MSQKNEFIDGSLKQALGAIALALLHVRTDARFCGGALEWYLAQSERHAKDALGFYQQLSNAPRKRIVKEAPADPDSAPF
jgi:hypothetical protein